MTALGAARHPQPLAVGVMGTAGRVRDRAARQRPRPVPGRGGFAIGEISELFQHNVGISPTRWDVVLAGSAVGAVIGLACATLGVLALVAQRRAKRAAERPESSRVGAI